MPAMAGGAVHLEDTVVAKLHPSGLALRAHAAPAIMMHHDALTDPCLIGGHVRADRDDHAAWLVPGDHRAAMRTERRTDRGLAGTIIFQVGPAHPGSLDLQHDLARPRRRIGELRQRNLPVSFEYDAFHRQFSRSRSSVTRIIRIVGALPTHQRGSEVRFIFSASPSKRTSASRHWRCGR
jgi:hypothetical protein